MTVVIQTRDRCRICFSLLLRDRSLCCQKSYHLFKHIERRKIPLKKSSSYQMKIRHPTVCFQDLILRYLHTQIPEKRNHSNLICSDCSMILLDIEQCAKYLRKTINQLKVKLNKSNRLRTSSLSATFQKKNQGNTIIKEEQLPISNSDSEEEFDDIDDEEEFDDDTKPIVSTDIKSKSLHLTSPLSPGSETTSSISRSKLHGNNNHHHECNEDEDGLIKTSSALSHARNNLPGSNGLITTGNTMNLLEETNPNLLQLRLAQMMVSAANTGQHFQDNHAMMNTLANIQRNMVLQFLSDPMAAAQAAAAAAAISSTQIKANLPAMSPNNKQIGSGRKRKSTPEKRSISNNNGNTSPRTIEHESLENNHPLELTMKGLQQSNRVLSSPDIHNLVNNSQLENGSSSSSYHINQHIDENRKESSTPNDSSLSLSPLLIRRPTGLKRQKVSPTGQYHYPNKLKINFPTDLLSPNHQLAHSDDPNQSKSQRKLDPRSCAECGKVLFSDKTHLLHCQTHAKNEKQCWICGMTDDDIKKHIINEHGNQKFTDTGFKCQHCEQVFPDYNDLMTHTREHSKRKPFECPICNKRFGQQGNLSCHLRIHSGVKPFNCTSCGKAFRHSNSLRRHARTVHSASRGLSMSPGSMTPTPSSLLLATATTSNSMVSMPNDLHRLSTSEVFDDATSGHLIPSDEAESLQGPPSVSTTDAPSPTVSNAQNDSDSHEQFGSS